MSYIAFDTETHIPAPGAQAPRVVCLSWAREAAEGLIVGDAVGPYFNGMIEVPDTLIAHNAAFDAGALMATFPELVEPIFEAYHEGRVECTMLREKLLDIAVGKHQIRRGRYTLLEIAVRYKITTERFDWTDPPREEKNDPDAWRFNYYKLDGVPFEQWPKKAVDYAIGDSELALAVHGAQQQRAQRLGYDLPDQEAQVRAHLALHLAGIWGVHTDPDHVEPLKLWARDRLAILADELILADLAKRTTKRDGTVKFSKSKKNLQALVRSYFEDQGLGVPVTDKGNVKTDKEVLDDIDDPAVEVYQEYAGIEKAKTTYIEKYEQGYALPIHASFNPIVDSGRSSCSKPNWQNQPTPRVLPGARECVIPRDGWVFVAADYDSQEMRTWADACVQLFGWSKLADAYQADPNFDPHTALAVGQLIPDEAITYEEGLQRKKIPGDIVKVKRQKAKIPNFGLPGGMGVKGLRKFARGMNDRITRDDAKALIEAWRTQWPEAIPYFDHIRALTGNAFGSRGTLTQLVSGRRRGRVTYTQAANSYFQGLAADCSKAALWEVSRRCYSVKSSALYGCRVWNFVHDEIVLECPEEQASAAAFELIAIMQVCMEEICKHVPSRASAAIMRRWYKEAEAVYELKDGVAVMVPWEPK